MGFRFNTRRSLGAGLIPGGGGAILKPQDVFATSLLTGTGAQQPVTTGIDMLTKGGLVWSKSRNNAFDHTLTDTVRGVRKALYTNLTNAETVDGVFAFSSTGYTFSPQSTSDNRVDYSFARAANFFDTNIFTHTNGTPTNIDLSSLGIVGDAVIKRRDAAGDWYVWHRSLAAGNNLRFVGASGSSPAQSTTDAFVSVSGTTLTFSAAAPSGSYMYEAQAHDPSTEGIVQCGVVTTASNGALSIPLPWLAQWVLFKNPTAGTDWWIFDTARPANAALRASTSVAEFSLSAGSVSFAATGITVAAGQLYGGANPVIFRAIRAPY